MKIKDLLFEIVLEEGAKEQMKNGLLRRWSNEDPNLSIEAVNYIWDVFKGENGHSGLVNKLSSKKDPIKMSFLTRFDGEHGFDRIDPTKILDINSYTLKQIVSLLDDYGFDVDIIDEGMGSWEEQFFKGGSKEEKFEFSKSLWFGTQNKVYDDGDGFRIYLPLNQKQSVAFGMYENYLADQLNGSHWCTTWNRSGNMWNTYRGKNMTLYYCIDEKIPATNQHHLFAILPTTRDYDTYEYTDLKNSGGNIVVQWNNPNDPSKSLVDLHPQLTKEGVRDIISKQVPYDPKKELNLSDEKLRLIDLINERPCTPGETCYDFSVQPKRVKLQYIIDKCQYQYLRELRSFQSMDEDLMNRYIETINDRNWTDRFQSYEIMKFILDNTKYKEKVIRVLRGEGLGGPVKTDGRQVSIYDLMEKVMTNKFEIAFVSTASEKIAIYKSNSEGYSIGKFGLFNRAAGDWYEKDGIVYEPDYLPVQVDGWPKTFFFKRDLEDIRQQQPEPQDQEQPEPDNTDQENVQEQDVMLEDMPENYFVTCYSKTNNADDTNNFYTLIDSRMISGRVKKGIIMSHSTYINKFLSEAVELDWSQHDFGNIEGPAPDWFRSDNDIQEKEV
jgi:hypothetical protein